MDVDQHWNVQVFGCGQWHTHRYIGGEMRTALAAIKFMAREHPIEVCRAIAPDGTQYVIPTWENAGALYKVLGHSVTHAPQNVWS
jgi:hypothetical protein